MSTYRPIRVLLPALALVGALLTAGNAVAAAPDKCTLAKIAEWPVRPGRGSPIVDGMINGQKVGVILDTGSTTYLLRSAAVRLGLIRHASAGRAIGIGGVTAVESASIDSFEIGATVRNNWRMRVVGEVDFGGDYAILLGEDFFHKADVEFDLAHNAVRLFQARDCDGTGLAYWATENASMAVLDPISNAFPRIELKVKVNGHPVHALLDSGANHSVLTKAQAAALGVTPQTAGVLAVGCSGGLGAKKIESWVGQFESVGIGNEVIRDPKLHFADLWKYSSYAQTGSRVQQTVVNPDMLLGADFLRSHRVLIAHSQQKMYFTYAGGTVFEAQSLRSCEEIERREAEKRQAPAAK